MTHDQRWPEGTVWTRHNHEAWKDRAGDPRMPYWLRVAAAAYGSHSPNGHAKFKRGELSLILGTPGPDGVTPYRNLKRAIELAVEYGWLEDGSFWGCLIVPSHAMKRGEWWDNSDCPVHRKRAIRAKRALPGLHLVPRESLAE